MTGSQVLRLSRKPSSFCSLPRFSDWTMVNVAVTSGIRSAMAKPSSTSCPLTVLMSTARLTLTAPLSTATAPPESPRSAATSSSWAVRLAATQASSKASEATSATTRSWTKLRMPVASGPASAPSVAAARGGSPCPSSAWTTSSTAASRSR